MRRIALSLSIVALLPLLLAGCPDRHPAVDGGPPDAGTPEEDARTPEDDADTPEDDAGTPDEDAGTPEDAGTIGDAGLDAGTMPDDAATPDGGMPTGGSMPAPAATIVRMGTGGFLLRGTVLAPGGPIARGEVLIVGDSITCVAADCSASPMAGTVTVIDTHATISAGLIDGHNHATYNFLPEWVPDPARLFASRYAWRSDPMYSAFIRPESDGGSSGTFICPASKWAELRSIVHGTTTIQGQSPNQGCVQRLARNADHAHGLGPDHMQTTISGACESALSDSARTTLVSNFTSGSTTRYAIHMAEGVTGTGTTTNVLREYECYAGTFRYSTSLLVDGSGNPFETAMFIHAVALTDPQLVEAEMLHARFVWSPSSNLILYGATAPIGRMIDLGLTIGLGPDWTLSGSDELLSEMRFALDWAAAEGVGQVTPEVLHRMATSDGADVVGLASSIGTLAPGRRADVVVFGRVGTPDPYRAVTDSRAADVRLVMIDGAAYYGDLALEMATAVNGFCEDFDACGTPKFLCAAMTPGNPSRADETVEQIRMQLYTHLMTYGRESELLELVDCSL